MVCVPCIIVPVVLWAFHKFIMPYLQPFLVKYGLMSPPKTEEFKSLEFTSDMLNTEEGKFLKGKIDENPVIIFSKTTCTYCKMAKKTLDDTGVNYAVEEIGGRDDLDKIQDLFLTLTGGRTVPRVIIGGKCIGGGSETMSMNSSGKLVPMMKEAGASFKKEE
jgi:glutaredoxin 3